MTLPAGIYFPLEMSYKDHTQEIGRFRVFSLPNNDPTTLADNTTQVDAFVAAMNAVVLGQLVEYTWNGLDIVDPVHFPSSPSSQRENKLLVRYHDATDLSKLTATIPCINLPILVFLSEAQDFVNPGTPSTIATLVSTWSATICNPRTGNLTAIDSLEFVGRRS